MRYSTGLVGLGALVFLLPVGGTSVVGAAVMGVGVLVRLFET